MLKCLGVGISGDNVGALCRTTAALDGGALPPRGPAHPCSHLRTFVGGRLDPEESNTTGSPQRCEERGRRARASLDRRGERMTSAPVVWPFLLDTVRVTPESCLTFQPATATAARHNCRLPPAPLPVTVCSMIGRAPASNVVCNAAQGACRALAPLDPRRDQRRSRPRSPRHPWVGGRRALHTFSRLTGAAHRVSEASVADTLRDRGAPLAGRETRDARSQRFAHRVVAASSTIASRLNEQHASAAAVGSAQRPAWRRRAAHPRLHHGARVTAMRPAPPPRRTRGWAVVPLVLLVRGGRGAAQRAAAPRVAAARHTVVVVSRRALLRPRISLCVRRERAHRRPVFCSRATMTRDDGPPPAARAN